ncbi:hypothetical protein CJ199_15800, partial [Brevibacterium paucivorans]
KLVKNEDYSGPREAKNGGVEIKFYESQKTAYSDVQSGNLDIGGHEEWVTAAANSIAKTLDIKAEGQAYPSFAELLDDQEQDKMTGAFRSGWQADFPAQVNFLAPLYQSGA